MTKRTRTNLKMLLIVAFFVVKNALVMAQDVETPVAYMNSITKVQEDMNKKYLAYVSASAHGKRLRKVEKLRQQAVESISLSLTNTQLLFPYKGDNSLRQSSIDYIKFCYKLFNDDYAHIVDLEEISEQSVDEMQAYLLLQEKTSEKLKEANQANDLAYRAFAAKYKIEILDSKSEKGEKMEIVGKLNKYFNKVYNQFFKSNWEDKQLTKALTNKKVNDIEQCRNTLIKYAEEGLKALDTLRSFNGDASLALACKQSLEAYKKLAETEIPKMTDYYLKEENFNNIKKSFDSKSASDRTKEDVDAYNKAVKEMNAGVNSYNQTNNNANNIRNSIVNNWNSTEKSFMDSNMPYFK
ncbi:hypothetical protein [Parasediminibacterium sp. JCM 36343]|uniref:LIC11966 family surface protein n=1 Tax=Parasediminibacterium sp. JCM 36343 TaxID=3374279 RepID=UPI00397CE1A4